MGITEKPKIMSTNLDMIRISGIQEELSKLNVTKDEYQIYTAMHQLDFKEPIELAFKALFMASDPLALLDAQCKLFQKWEPRYYSVIISVVITLYIIYIYIYRLNFYEIRVVASHLMKKEMTQSNF